MAVARSQRMGPLLQWSQPERLQWPNPQRPTIWDGREARAELEAAQRQLRYADMSQTPLPPHRHGHDPLSHHTDMGKTPSLTDRAHGLALTDLYVIGHVLDRVFAAAHSRSEANAANAGRGALLEGGSMRENASGSTGDGDGAVGLRDHDPTKLQALFEQARAAAAAAGVKAEAR